MKLYLYSAIFAASQLATISPSRADSFADDFNTNTINTEFSLHQRNTDEAITSVISDGEAASVVLVHSDPTNALANDKKAELEFRLNNGDLIEATGIFTGSRPETGALRFEAFGRFFNKTIDGGPVTGERIDDVEVEIELQLGANPEDDFALYCFKERDANSDSQPVFNDQRCYDFELSELAVDTPYRIALGIDRNTQELIAELNEERIVEASPYTFFEVGDNSKWTRFRVRDGAAAGTFSLQSLSVDDTAIDLSAVDAPVRYRTDDFDDFRDDPNRSKEIVDGRLKLATTVSDVASDNVSFLRLADQSNHIEAELEFSSESAVAFPTGNGFASIRIAGILFNTNSAGESDELGQAGNVWGSVNLIRNGSDSGRLVGEYCLIRNDSGDWSVTADLADGLDDMRCPVFDINIVEDTAYKAALTFDPQAKTVTFSLGGDTKTISLNSDVFIRSDEILRVQARMAAGATGTIVSYTDNLRNDPDALTDEERANATSGGNSSDSGSTGGSSGGGGFSLQMLIVVFMVMLARSSRALRKD